LMLFHYMSITISLLLYNIFCYDILNTYKLRTFNSLHIGNMQMIY